MTRKRTSGKRFIESGQKRGDERAKTLAFARGMRQFNAREFWHAHESWEVIWLPAPQPEKTFLQGLIQISAGFFHHQRKNLIGARSLLARGLEKVERFPGRHRGLRLEELRRIVRTWLAQLETGDPCLEKQYPKLRPSRSTARMLPRRSSPKPQAK